MGMFILGQVRMEKGGRHALLQGVCHRATPPFWERIQGEVDRVAAEGYKIFYEGIGLPRYPTHNIREQRFRSLVTAALNRDARVSAVTLTSQDVGLCYPEGAINADVSISEIATLLAATDIPDDMSPAAFLKMFSNPPPELEAIFVEYRDRSVISTIKEKSEGANIFLLYGEGHLPGMRKFLAEDAWVDRGWSMFDFQITS